MQDYAQRLFKSDEEKTAKPQNLAKSLKYSIVLTVFVCVFVLGFVIGQIANFQLSFLKTSEEEFKNTILKNQSSPNLEVDFGEFWKVWALLNQKHINSPFDQNQLMFGAIKGMVDSINDPHTTFFDKIEAEQFNKALNGNFDGVGIEVEEKDGSFIILSTLDNTPAQQQGLKAGDIITEVDDKSVAGFKVEEVVLKIRGPQNTKVKLNILREGIEKSFELTRAKISVPSVKWDMLDNNLAYLRVIQFSDSTSSKFDEIAAEITAQNPAGIILDLRNNRGGYLDAGIHIAKAFFSDGIVMKQKTKTEEKEFSVDQPGIFKDIPLVVLINGYSASASEIVAGAIKDRKRGQLLGTASFGKGKIQTIESFDNGTQVRITIAQWFPPLSGNVNGIGIQPDIVVPIVKNTPMESPIPEASPTPADIQLLKAVELLTNFKSSTTPQTIITITPSPTVTVTP